MPRALAAFVVLLAGCPGLPRDTGTPAPTASRVEDLHNFAAEISFDAEIGELRAGTDATLSWAALSRDLLGRPLESCAALTRATLYLLPRHSEAEILAQLPLGSLPSTGVGAIWDCAPADCGCRLADFSFVGHPLLPADDFVEGRGSWLLALTGEDGGGLRGLAFLAPREAAEGTRFALTDASFSAVARGVPGPPLPGVRPDVPVDWSGLATDGQGQPFEHGRVDLARLDRVEGDAAAALADLLALDDRSLDRWETTLQGDTRVTLQDLQGERVLEGLESSSTWLLSLWCTTCLLDLPRAVVVLEGAEGQG